MSVQRRVHVRDGAPRNGWKMMTGGMVASGMGPAVKSSPEPDQDETRKSGLVDGSFPFLEQLPVTDLLRILGRSREV